MVLCLTARFSVSFAQDTVISAPAFDVNVEAEAVMDSYFRALATGDSASLEIILGGGLLAKRRMLLGNPAYSDLLIDAYQGADFKVLKYENNSPDSVTVEALISFAQGETVRKRYQLERAVSHGQQSSFVIVNETALAEPMQKQGL